MAVLGHYRLPLPPWREDHVRKGPPWLPEALPVVCSKPLLGGLSLPIIDSFPATVLPDTLLLHIHERAGRARMEAGSPIFPDSLHHRAFRHWSQLLSKPLCSSLPILPTSTSEISRQKASRGHKSNLSRDPLTTLTLGSQSPGDCPLAWEGDANLPSYNPASLHESFP